MAFNCVLLGYKPVLQLYKAAQIEPQKQILCTFHTQISHLLIIWYLDLFVPYYY